MSGAGAIAGFLAVSILVILLRQYLVQKREIDQLRRWAGNRPERAQQPRGRRPPRASAIGRDRPRAARPRHKYLILGAGLTAGAVIAGLTVSGAVWRPDEARHRERVVRRLPAPADVKVAVLNGSGTPGLALEVSARLAKRGFRKGLVANAAGPPRRTTVVSYGADDRPGAKAVARILRVRELSPLDSSIRAVAGASVDVVVVVGGDRSA